MVVGFKLQGIQLLPCKTPSCRCCGDVNTPMGMIPVETRSQREKKLATKAETPTSGDPFPGLCATQVQEVGQELHEATPPVAFPSTLTPFKPNARASDLPQDTCKMPS